MKTPLTRSVLALLTVLSALLFILTVIVWIASELPRGVMYGWSRNNVGYQIVSSGGTLSFITTRNGRPIYLASGNGYSEIARQVPMSLKSGFGISYGRSVWVKARDFASPPLPGTYGNITEFGISLWWPLLISLPLGVVAARALILRRRKSVSSNLICTNCGYDLRATPERCPECGKPQIKSEMRTD